jgi:hypothetical protein
MTYAIAKLRIWFAETYTREQVREAALFILGSLDADQEDINLACSLL